MQPLTSIPVPTSLSLPGAMKPSGNERSFEDVMADTTEGAAKLKTVREESRKLVAEAFITPLLAQIRENNKAAAPFGPTDGEKRFGPIFDQAVADSMSRPDRFPMVKAVERSILQRIELAEQGDQR